MSGPIAFAASMAVGHWQPDQFVTAHDWTYGRDGNVNPVLHARFSAGDDEFDGYAKPFSFANPLEATVILNEVTGWLIARASGLPAPDRAFFIQLNPAELPAYTGPGALPATQDGLMWCFVTQAVGNTAIRAVYNTDLLVKEQSRWDQCDHTIAFDEAVANPDRHPFNLLRRGENDFVLIDHGFLLENGAPYPSHWAEGAIEAQMSGPIANALHNNTYLYLGRTSKAVCSLGCTKGEVFSAKIDAGVRRVLYEIAFWCSKLLPGKSSRWLAFLYSRAQSPVLVPLLLKRYGLLHNA